MVHSLALAASRLPSSLRAERHDHVHHDVVQRTYLRIYALAIVFVWWLVLDIISRHFGKDIGVDVFTNGSSRVRVLFKNWFVLILVGLTLAATALVAQFTNQTALPVSVAVHPYFWQVFGCLTAGLCFFVVPVECVIIPRIVEGRYSS